jgi:hypothetical protein
MYKMKKSVVSALAAAVVLGAMSAPVFAAQQNPFTDVPRNHWAYDSIEKLRKAGIVEGYKDGNYRSYVDPNGRIVTKVFTPDEFGGQASITRYEMAQLVARALANYDNNGNYALKSDLDALEAEFRNELELLGIKTDDLRDHSDKLQWHGKVEYTYGNFKPDGREKQTSNGYVFRLEPVAYVDDNCWVATNEITPTDDGYRHGHWSVRARLDASGDMREDTTNDVTLKRAYVQGEWDKFAVKAGRFGFCPPEEGVAIDTVISGGELKFGSKWKATITAGRINAVNAANEASYLTTPINDGRISRNILPEFGNSKSNVIALHVNYDDPGDKGLFGGIGYTHAKNNDFANFFYSDDADTTKADVISAHLGYRFNEKMFVKLSGARNGKADNEKDAWDVIARYGDYADASEKGQWAVWAGYSKFGANVAIASDQTDDIRTGSKGWHIGAAWAPFKNVGLLARYGHGKYITGGDKYKKIFGRVEMFF